MSEIPNVIDLIWRVAASFSGGLRKHYTTELQRGAATVEAKLVGNLLKLASGSDGTALKAIMFALQCRFGWSLYPRSLGRRHHRARGGDASDGTLARLGAVVGLAKRSAAFIRMKAGLVIRPRSFKSR